MRSGRAGVWAATIGLVGLMSAAATVAADAPVGLELQATAGLHGGATLDSAEAGVEPDAVDGEPAPRRTSEARRRERERVHNTWLGSSGGFHVADAGTGLAGSMRIQLALDFFGATHYLRYGDEHRSSAGTLSLGYTLFEHLELFGSLAARSNYNDFGRVELLQVVGDMLLGVKGAYAPVPWLSVGGELRLFVPSGVGDVGVGFDGTSVGLRGNASADLRRLGSGAPLIARLGLGYLFDQSANLIDDVESARYRALDNPLSRADEDRHLVTRQERLAFGINRVDRFDVELGLEVPLRVVEDFHIHPLLEWRLGVPVNRQSYDCLRVDTDADARSPDGCLKEQGVAAMPMTMTLGARLYPWLTGLSVALGVDVGLTGTRSFVREVAPNRPWALLIALGYAHQPGRRPPPPPAALPAEPAEPARADVRLNGRVMDEGSHEAIVDARVEYLGRELTDQITDADGRFVSYPFAPGEVRMRVSHPDYEASECVATVSEVYVVSGGVRLVDALCVLSPRARLGALDGTVKAASGTALAGVQVRLSGPHSAELTTDAAGRFAASELPPGAYELEVSAPGHAPLKRTLLVPGNQTLSPELVLSPVAPPPPQVSSVRVTKRAVVIKRAVHFRHNSAELEVDSFALLDEVAAVLIQNPELLRVEVQGHTDNRGSSAVNRALSQSRADTVREYLVRAGVASERLSAKGYGDARPLVPNLTDRNRARNRRVEFIILERAQ